MVVRDFLGQFRFTNTRKPRREEVSLPCECPRTSPPTRELGQHGLDLWCSIQGEYLIEDPGGIETLMQACAALDRAEFLAEQIAADGPTIPDPPGRGSSLHHRRNSMSELYCRALAKLGVLHEPIRAWDPDRARKRSPSMTTNRTPIARERRGRITADQQQALWLGGLSDAFESEDEAGRHGSGTGRA